MPVLDASALTTDPEGLEFLRDVLGKTVETAAPGRRFPREAWMPRLAAHASIDPTLASATDALDRIEPRFAETRALTEAAF